MKRADTVLLHKLRQNTADYEGYVEITTRRVKTENVNDRRMTVASLNSLLTEQRSSDDRGRIRGRWWEIAGPVYSFTDRKVSQRLQMLTGITVVNIFDRLFWQKLKQALLLEFTKQQNDRIHKRTAEELKRQANEIPADKCDRKLPESVTNHPVYKMYAKMKCFTGKLGIHNQAKNHEEIYKMSLSEKRRTGNRTEIGRKTCNPDCEPEHDLAKGFMMTDSQFLFHKYEDRSIITALMGNSVEGLYRKAVDLIGPPRTVAEPLLPDDSQDFISN